MKSRINKIKKSIRAISPVISVLLMIAIAVVASLVAYMWMMGYIGGKTTQVGKAVLIQSMANDTYSHLVVYVQNVGQGNVIFDPPNTAYVNSQLQSSSILITTLAPGQTTPINTNYKVTSTDPITVKIVTMDGTFAQTTGTPSNGAPTNSQPIMYSVTFIPGTGGSVFPTGSHSLPAGFTAAIVAAASNGYQFSGWTSTGTITFDSASSASTNAHISSDGLITANFVAVAPGQNYQVNFVLGTGGSSMSPAAGSHTYAGGSTVAISTTAATGYQFSGWTSTGTITFDSASSASTNAHIGGAGSISANFVVNNQNQNYQVTFILGAGGSLISPPTGNRSYPAGTIVPLTATPATGYQFSYWTSTGSITFDSTVSASTNAHIGSDGTITANFVAVNPGQNYQVTFVLGSGGASMSPTGSHTYAGGSTVAISTTAAAGYQFAGWTSTGTISFDSASAASTNAHIDGAGSVTANFVAVSPGQNYQVTFNLGAGGASMSPAGSQTYAGGSTVAISTTAASGYMFAGWTSTGTISFDSASSPSTNAYIGSAGSITANFVAVSPGQNYQVTFNLGAGGASMSPAGSQTYAGGSTVAISTSAAAGYQFAGWTSTGTISFDSASAASTNAHIGSDGSITANFVANSPGQNYAVIFVLGSGGSSMSPAAGSQTYAGGSTVAISTTASSGYMFAGWTSTGTITFDSSSSASTNAHIDSAGSITANFVANSPGSTYQVTFVLGSGGASMSPAAGAHSYSGGSTVPLTATAASGYQFLSWSSTGTITFDSASSSATNAHIGSDGTVTANFVVVNAGQSYTVTFVLGAGGSSMTPTPGAHSYSGGSTVPLTATAASGYQFLSWSSTGTITFDSASSSATNAHIGSDGTVTANFVAYKLVFITGSSQTLAPNSYSTQITVQRQDQNGNPVTTGGSITVSLTTTASTTGHFYSPDSDGNPGSQTTSRTISSGSSTAIFFYRDSAVGTPTITASSAPLQPATTQFTITNLAIVNIASSFTPTNSITPGSQVKDTAKLVGATTTAGGTFTYYLYRGTYQIGTPTLVDSNTVTVTNGAVPDSKQFTIPAADSYFFLTKYSGDSNNGPISGNPEEFIAWPLSQTILLRPNADTSDSDLGTSGSSSHYACVNQATSDGDSTYVYNKLTSFWTDDVYDFQNPTHTGTVAYITVNGVARNTGGAGSMMLAITTNGQEYDGSNNPGLGFPLTSSYLEYTTVWKTNPATGASWTWANIDALQIGVSLYSGTANGARCTQVYIQVYYTP